MMAQISTIRRVIFLFGLMIFFISAEANANILKTTIITENGETMELKWKETEQLLANENLPIWTTTYSQHHLLRHSHIMEELGSFKTYHDLDKSSAIVVLEKLDCLFGVIDVRYKIVCLPLAELEGRQHKIGESQHILIDNNYVSNDIPVDLYGTPHIELGSNTPNLHRSDANYKMLIKTYVNPNKLNGPYQPHCAIQETRPSVIVSPTSFEGPPPNKLRRLDSAYAEEVITIYPEILIFVSHEIVSMTKLMSTLVLRQIVDLNAAAMLFRKLATHNIKIHINIAGIVIDRDGLGFPPALLFTKNHPKGQAVLDSISSYIQQATDMKDYRRSIFSIDSFDMFLYATTKEWAELREHPHEFSSELLNMRKQRILQQRGSGIKKKYLGSIVDYMDTSQHYVNAARAIAHLMTVKDDPLNSDVCRNGAQCAYGIEAQNPKCAECLTWSPASIQSFKEFLSTSQNRCYLRNRPRSLYPYSFPMQSMIPADQCLCFGLGPDKEATTHLNAEYGIGSRVCQRMMQCSTPLSGSKIPHFAYPIDGTPCDKEDNDKVCWNSKCVTTKVSIYREK